MTEDETKEFAKSITNLVIASLMDRHPIIVKAIDKINRDKWIETVDEVTEQVESALDRRLNP